MEPIWFALLNTATPNSLPNRNTLLQRWRYGKYLIYGSLFTQIHGSTHCTYLVIIELCGCFRVFLDYDHASFMTHTYIIRIGRLLFQWQKLLTSACRRCRVSAVAESVSDTDRSTGFAQIMCGTYTSRLQTQCWPPFLTGPIIASARWTPWHCCGAFRFPETCIDSKLNTTVPHCQLIPTTSRQIALTVWQCRIIKK